MDGLPEGAPVLQAGMASMSDRTEPRVWLLLGNKAGDNAQLRTLAAALGWPVEEKRIIARKPLYRLPNLLLGSSLASINQRRSAALVPPWPDLVIASGRRTAPAALWIRRQSGGRTRLIHVGRPWAPLSWFDFVVAMPQYGLPKAANVVQARMPFNRFSPARLQEGAQRHGARLAHLPRPWTVLIVGGAGRSLAFDPEFAARLGREVNARVLAEGGSLLVTTSRRTPRGPAAALRAQITAPGEFYQFKPDDPDNPLAGYVALADTIVVTGDSAAMMAETLHLGKPVWVAPVPERPDRRTRLTRALRRHLPRSIYRRLVSLGLVTSTRDVGSLAEALIREGWVGRLGGEPPRRRIEEDDLQRVAAQIKAALASPAR